MPLEKENELQLQQMVSISGMLNDGAANPVDSMMPYDGMDDM